MEPRVLYKIVRFDFLLTCTSQNELDHLQHSRHFSISWNVGTLFGLRCKIFTTFTTTLLRHRIFPCDFSRIFRRQTQCLRLRFSQFYLVKNGRHIDTLLISYWFRWPKNGKLIVSRLKSWIIIGYCCFRIFLSKLFSDFQATPT